MSRKPFTLIPEKMEAVVSAAIKEFSRYGYSHASTNRICAEAGISKGALFHNFRSKENLFFFVVSDGIRTAESIFNEYLKSHFGDMPFEEVFFNSFDMLFNFIRNYPDHYAIYLRLIYDPDIPSKERSKVKRIIKKFTSSISDTLYEVGKKKKLIREKFDTGLVRFVFNTLITRFVELYFFPLRDPGLDIRKKSKEEISGLIYSLYDLLMDGLRKS